MFRNACSSKEYKFRKKNPSLNHFNKNCEKKMPMKNLAKVKTFKKIAENCAPSNKAGHFAKITNIARNCPHIATASLLTTIIILQ